MSYRIAGHDEVVKMALEGVFPGEIARITGLSINTVYWDLATARKKGIHVPKFSHGRTRKLGCDIRIPREAMNALESEAVARGLTAKCLAGRILIQVVEDNLVRAVLDDGERDE